MKLTGQAEKDFEKWYLLSFLKKIDAYLTTKYASKDLILFYGCNYSMQYGVYVDWFDSVGVSIEDFGVVMYSFNIKCGFKPKDRYINNPTFQTRTEARTKAIEKATEIYNNDCKIQ